MTIFQNVFVKHNCIVVNVSFDYFEIICGLMSYLEELSVLDALLRYSCVKRDCYIKISLIPPYFCILYESLVLWKKNYYSDFDSNNCEGWCSQVLALKEDYKLQQKKRKQVNNYIDSNDLKSDSPYKRKILERNNRMLEYITNNTVGLNIRDMSRTLEISYWICYRFCQNYFRKEVL